MIHFVFAFSQQPNKAFKTWWLNKLYRQYTHRKKSNVGLDLFPIYILNFMDVDEGNEKQITIVDLMDYIVLDIDC